jgi:hypothetical protein
MRQDETEVYRRRADLLPQIMHPILYGKLIPLQGNLSLTVFEYLNEETARTGSRDLWACAGCRAFCVRFPGYFSILAGMISQFCYFSPSCQGSPGQLFFNHDADDFLIRLFHPVLSQTSYISDCMFHARGHDAVPAVELLSACIHMITQDTCIH